MKTTNSSISDRQKVLLEHSLWNKWIMYKLLNDCEILEPNWIRAANKSIYLRKNLLLTTRSKDCPFRGLPSLRCAAIQSVSFVVRRDKRATSCWTNDAVLRNLSAFLRTPLTVIIPVLGDRRPDIMLKNEDFPAPEGPIIPVSFPGWNCPVTFCSIFFSCPATWTTKMN